MADNHACSRCGSALDDSTMDGYCLGCLLREGLAEFSEVKPAGSGQRFGNYELLGKIGQGGMGVVYRARQINLDRVVAVKLLPFSQFTSEEAVQRFQAEASAAAGLQHPNIIAIHEVGQHEGQHYFSMDFIEGRTLAEVVREKPMPAKPAAACLQTVAEAVHYAHQHGILHRDLKPSNILMDADGQPHIADFGLAKRLTGDSDLTLTGQVLGSPNYLPPEQASGNRAALAPPSDVYALGAILYHLLTGRPPFTADSLTTLLKQVLESDPVSPRLLNPSIPRDLETVCLKCLEKESRRRYATAGELAVELGRCLRDEPVRARPVSAPEKAWRWCRRQPVRASLAGALVLVFLTGLTGVLWQWQQARANELLARQNAYAADMNLAQGALEKGDLGGALALLKAQRPGPGQRDLRGWEWRYLWQRCQSEERFLFCQYSNSVAALAFSADGKRLALRCERGVVALWDTATQQPVVELHRSGLPKALALSPQGNLIAYGSPGTNGSPVAGLWNVVSRQEVRLPQSSPVQRMEFSPDGTRLATLTIGGTLSLWEIASQRVIASLRVPALKQEWTGRIRFSPQGDTLALGLPASLQLWQWATDRRRMIALPTTTNYVTGLAFSRDGTRLVASCNRVQVWDVTHLWDLPEGSEVPVIGQPFEPEDWVTDLAVSPDGETLATASVDQAVRLWDLKSGRELRRYQGNTHEVWALAISPDGKDLVSGGRDGSVRFWNPQSTATPSAYSVLPMPVWLPGFTFAPDGKRFIAVNATNGVASLWDTAALQPLEQLSFLGRSNSAVRWAPDGRTLAVGDWTGNLRVWDYPARRVITNFVAKSSIVMIRFFAEGRSLWYGIILRGNRRVFGGYRTADWSPIRLPGDWPPKVNWAGQSADGRTVVAVDEEGTVVCWDLASGTRRPQVKQHFPNADAFLVYSPDGRTLAGSSLYGLTTLWDAASGRELATVRGNVRAVRGIAFTPDGQRLLSGGRDPSDAVRVMDVSTRRYVATLPGQADDYWFVEMSADGSTLVAVGSQKKAALVWQAPSWAEIAAVEKGQPRPVAQPQ